MFLSALVHQSSLIRRFVDDSFTDSHIAHPFSVDFKFRPVTLDGKTVILQIWDTVGREWQKERMHSVNAHAYQHAHGILVVYDVTDANVDVQLWLREISDYASEDVVTMLVGNKVRAAHVCGGSRELRELLCCSA
jgi:small GTP-binding protein